MVAPRSRRMPRPKRSKGGSFQFIMYIVVIGSAMYYISSGSNSFEENESTDPEPKPDYLRGTSNYGNSPSSNEGDQKFNMNQEEFVPGLNPGEPGPGQDNNINAGMSEEEVKIQEMNKAVEDMKNSLVQAEQDEIEKEKELILKDPLKMAEEDIEEVMGNILHQSNVEVPLSTIENLAEEVKEKLEYTLDHDLRERSDQILQNKENELETVVQEDRGIFSDADGLVKDVSEMEKFIENDMNSEIDLVAEDLRSKISEKTEKIEQEVIEERLGIHFDEEQFKVEEEYVKQSHEVLNEETEALAVLSTVDKAMDEIQQAKENLAEDERDKLDEYVQMLEQQTKEVVETVMSNQDAGLAAITIDHVVKEMNVKLEEEAENEIEKQTEKILQDKLDLLTKEVEEDQQFMADPEDIKNDIEIAEQKTIEEMSKEIKHATVLIKENLETKRAEIEKEILEQVGVDVNEQELQEANADVKDEHDAELMETLMNSVQTRVDNVANEADEGEVESPEEIINEVEVDEEEEIMESSMDEIEVDEEEETMESSMDEIEVDEEEEETKELIIDEIEEEEEEEAMEPSVDEIEEVEEEEAMELIIDEIEEEEEEEAIESSVDEIEEVEEEEAIESSVDEIEEVEEETETEDAASMDTREEQELLSGDEP